MPLLLLIAAADVLPIISAAAALLVAAGGLYVGRKTSKSQDRKSALEELVAVTAGWKSLKEDAEARATRTEELLQKAATENDTLHALIDRMNLHTTELGRQLKRAAEERDKLHEEVGALSIEITHVGELRTEVQRLRGEIDRLSGGGTDGP